MASLHERAIPRVKSEPEDVPSSTFSVQASHQEHSLPLISPEIARQRKHLPIGMEVKDEHDHYRDDGDMPIKMESDDHEDEMISSVSTSKKRKSPSEKYQEANDGAFPTDKTTRICAASQHNKDGDEVSPGRSTYDDNNTEVATALPPAKKQKQAESGENPMTTIPGTICVRCKQVDSEFWRDSKRKRYCIPCAVLKDAKKCASRAIVSQLLMKKSLKCLQEQDSPSCHEAAKAFNEEEEEGNNDLYESPQESTPPDSQKISTTKREWEGTSFCKVNRHFPELSDQQKSDCLRPYLHGLMDLKLVRDGEPIKDWNKTRTSLLSEELTSRTIKDERLHGYPDTESLRAVFRQCSICKETKFSTFSGRHLRNGLTVDMCKPCSSAYDLMFCELKELAAKALHWVETECRQCMDCKQMKSHTEYARAQWPLWQSYCIPCGREREVADRAKKCAGCGKKLSARQFKAKSASYCKSCISEFHGKLGHVDEILRKDADTLIMSALTRILKQGRKRAESLAVLRADLDLPVELMADSEIQELAEHVIGLSETRECAECKEAKNQFEFTKNEWSTPQASICRLCRTLAKCHVCKEIKPKNEFSKKQWKLKSSSGSTCKACSAEISVAKQAAAAARKEAARLEKEEEKKLARLARSRITLCCSACKVEKNGLDFSAQQLRRGNGKAKCIPCFNKVKLLGMVCCNACLLDKRESEFSPEQLRFKSKGKAKCIACLGKQEVSAKEVEGNGCEDVNAVAAKGFEEPESKEVQILYINNRDEEVLPRCEQVGTKPVEGKIPDQVESSPAQQMPCDSGMIDV